jgi:hypothetical protein
MGASSEAKRRQLHKTVIPSDSRGIPAAKPLRYFQRDPSTYARDDEQISRDDDLPRVVRLHAVFAQFFAQHGQMLAVSCFHRAKDMHRRNVRAGEGAIVHDLFDACAARRDLRGQIRQSARPITDDGDETRQPSIGDKTAFDDSAQDIGINIAATKEKHDAFAGKIPNLAGQAGRQRSGGSPFNDAFLQLHYPQNR